MVSSFAAYRLGLLFRLVSQLLPPSGPQLSATKVILALPNNPLKRLLLKNNVYSTVSVEGLSLDFLFLNLWGFLCYSVHVYSLSEICSYMYSFCIEDV